MFFFYTMGLFFNKKYSPLEETLITSKTIHFSTGDLLLFRGAYNVETQVLQIIENQDWTNVIMIIKTINGLFVFDQKLIPFQQYIQPILEYGTTIILRELHCIRDKTFRTNITSIIQNTPNIQGAELVCYIYMKLGFLDTCNLTPAHFSSETPYNVTFTNCSLSHNKQFNHEINLFIPSLT